jgi:hypothetical protein
LHLSLIFIPRGLPMFEVLTGLFIIFSAGVFVAHALEAYRS